MICKKPNRKIKVFVAILLCFTAIVAPLAVLGSAFAMPPTRVWGSVIDEEGNGIGSATVEIYKLNGDFVTSATTNGTGEFVTNYIDFGTYRFHFIKLGYLEIVEDFEIRNFDHKLDTIVLPFCLSLSTSIVSLVTSPGQQVSLPLTVTYRGALEKQIVEFEVIAPEELSAKVLQGSYEVTKTEVSKGQSFSIQVELSIPQTAQGGTIYNLTLKAIGQIAVSKDFTLQVPNQVGNAQVTGIVEDDKNNPIAGVTVEAHGTTNGAFSKTATTAADGSFSLELPKPNAYTLEFSKEGYLPTTQTVSLTAASTEVKAEDTELSKILWLTSAILGIKVNPGDKLTLPFMVSNVGTEVEAASFSYDVPEGWRAKVVDSNGNQITETALSPSGHVNMQLEVFVPLEANGDYDVAVIATGGAATALTYTAHVEPTDEDILSCQYPGKSSNAGDIIKFKVGLTNPFSVPMRFDLSVISVPGNWTAFIKNADGEYLTEVTLSAKEEIELSVEVKSTSASLTNQTYELGVTAQATNQELSQTMPISVTLTELANEITLTARLPEVAVEAGASVSYPLTVSNLGSTDRYLLLSVDKPANWKAYFKLGNVEVTRLYLYGGNTSDLTLEVVPPNTVALDTFTFPVQIKSESGVVLAQANLTTTVVGSYNLGVSLSTYMATASSGETASFSATLTNTGYTTLTDIGMNITLPADGWSVKISPVHVDALKSRESATFNIEVTTPENTVAGDYMVSVKGESSQMGSGITQVRVTVSASTSWGIYGIAIAGIFIFLLVGVFWKFKRR
ncbi:MAG: hypothetical protein CW716_06155 [Candidatus Bathyarchaeum sp.]|nr:MAG: hypothetical protein CW716_06155 [Candidatus Bathyarchaeum sp.]